MRLPFFILYALWGGVCFADSTFFWGESEAGHRHPVTFSSSSQDYSKEQVRRMLFRARDAFNKKDKETLMTLDVAFPKSHPLAPYPLYWLSLLELKKHRYDAARFFLQRFPNVGPLSEQIRKRYAKSMAKQGFYTQASPLVAALPDVALDDELRCLKALGRTGSWTQDALSLAGRLNIQGPACYEILARSHKTAQIENKIRYLLSKNRISAAKKLALRSSLPWKDSYDRLYTVLRKIRKDSVSQYAQFGALSSTLSGADRQVATAVLATNLAKKHHPAALSLFGQVGDPTVLSDEHLGWWARSAIRQHQWDALVDVIGRMPERMRYETTWLYWLGYAKQSLNDQEGAKRVWTRVSRHKRDFYGILARESLGLPFEKVTRTKQSISHDHVYRMLQRPGLQRASLLLRWSQFAQRDDLRADARREWRWAARNMTDQQLLSLAHLANRKDWSFYEMGVFSAEQTKQIHNEYLRYPTHFLKVINHQSSIRDVDPAWVLGLIRQESRFMQMVKSRAGAGGLMQLMPKTAKWMAGKIGKSAYSVNRAEDNIELGTAYLKTVYNQRGQSEVLATTGYNAGPGRARRWQDAHRVLAAAIYIETIPFTETRKYVKKVMANAYIYDHLYFQGHRSLHRRIGEIGAK